MIEQYLRAFHGYGCDFERACRVEHGEIAPYRHLREVPSSEFARRVRFLSDWANLVWC